MKKLEKIKEEEDEGEDKKLGIKEIHERGTRKREQKD